MRNRSETWKSLARHGRFIFDVKARINGRDYVKISAPKINRALMSSPLSVGNCNSASLSLSVLTEDKIPPGSNVVILGRLLDNNSQKATEWIEFGTFFIDKRETSFEGLITLDCYDAMQKLNQSYLDPNDITGTWPRSMKSVVEEVAYRIGVGIDPRTRIRTETDYIVTYPEGKTMQEVMGYIAACHGGNWIISDENLLRLVPLVTAPDETFHVIDEDYRKITVPSWFRLAYRDTDGKITELPTAPGVLPESTVHRTFFIIDDHGRQIVTPEGYFLIWDTEEKAIKLFDDESLLNIPVVCGSLDTGDLLTVSGVQISDEDDGDFSAGDDSGFVLDIGSNPYATQNICNDLYAAYSGLAYQPFTATQALFDPALELGDQLVIGDRVNGVLMSERLSFEHNFRADLEAPNDEELNREYPYLTTYEKLDSVQKQADRNKENLRKITVRVERTEDSVESEITRAKGEESRISQKLDSITLSVSNGSTSSTIQLKAGNTVISSENIEFSGVVNFTDLSVTNNKTQINGGNITTGTIDADRVDLAGDYGGFTSGTGSSDGVTTYGAKMYEKSGQNYVIVTNAGARMTAGNTNLYCENGAIRMTSDNVYISGNCTVNGTLKSGDGTVQKSDRNLKCSISHDLENYKDFFSALNPTIYKFKAGTSGRLHMGFIAQEVEEALVKAGLTNQDFAGLCIDTRKNENGEKVTEYGLRYAEFVALNTYMLHRAFAEIDGLRQEIRTLKERVDILEGRNSNG